MFLQKESFKWSPSFVLASQKLPDARRLAMCERAAGGLPRGPGRGSFDSLVRDTASKDMS